ncbi:MAG: hypothetical protein J7484_14310 [Microbacterium sp.]|nr:hypothetical protein [Microbacterium sp.]
MTSVPLGDERESPAPEPPPRHLWLRSLGVIAASGAAMLLADAVVSYSILLAWPMGPVAFLVGIPVTAVLLVLVIVGVSKALTRRAHGLGAVVVTLLLVGIGAYGFTNGILTLLILDPVPHLIPVLLCAVSLGLFLGPWPIRILGALAAAAAIAFMAVQPTNAQRQAEAAAQAEDQREVEPLSAAIDQGRAPLVADTAGWRIALVSASSGYAMSWLVGEDGAVAIVTAVPIPTNALDSKACTTMAPPGSGLAGDGDRMPVWCLRTDTGWARADGLGIAYLDQDRLVALHSAVDDEMQRVGSGQPASAGDIAELIDSLRPMTLADLDGYFADDARIPR